MMMTRPPVDELEHCPCHHQQQQQQLIRQETTMTTTTTVSKTHHHHQQQQGSSQRVTTQWFSQAAIAATAGRAMTRDQKNYTHGKPPINRHLFYVCKEFSLDQMV
jgi:hypothetical protein